MIANEKRSRIRERLNDPTQRGWVRRLASEGARVYVTSLDTDTGTKHQVKIVRMARVVETGWYRDRETAVIEGVYEYLYPSSPPPDATKGREVERLLDELDCGFDYAGVVVGFGGSYTQATTLSPDGERHRVALVTPQRRYASGHHPTLHAATVDVFHRYLTDAGRLSRTARRRYDAGSKFRSETRRRVGEFFGSPDPTKWASGYLDRYGAWLDLTMHLSRRGVEYSAAVDGRGRSNNFTLPTDALIDTLYNAVVLKQLGKVS
jgi:hypothetical protein